MPERSPETLSDDLLAWLRALPAGGIGVAFSGGADSTLLLAAAARSGRAVTALTAHTALHSPAELQRAESLAASLGVPLQVFRLNPLELPPVRANATDRCYHCKRALFAQMLAFAAAQGITTLADGSNADDARVYRPGRRALRELGVRSPLAELGFSKADIRRLSAALGLPTATAPAVPCLATRFDYGTELTDEALRRVQAGEAVLHRLLPGAADLRLRVQGELARLEVPPAQFPAVLAAAAPLTAELKQLGYRYITLDLEGFRSGSFDIARHLT